MAGFELRKGCAMNGRARGLDQQFLAEMRRKLASGRRKGRIGWDRHWDCYMGSVDELWFVHRIQDELCELVVEIEKGNADGILEECADIANFAMMCADVAKLETSS